MIVRISSEGQFRVPDAEAVRLNELDNAAVAAIASGDEANFRAHFTELIDHVRAVGEVLGDGDLEESDVIVPPPDTSMAEAARDFAGDGIIPG